MQFPGPAPFTGESARKYSETVAKAKLALAKCKAGEEVTDEKQLTALHRISELGSGKNVFGHHSDGFQMLRAFTDPANYKVSCLL